MLMIASLTACSDHGPLVVSEQCEKFLKEQSRKFLFLIGEPMKIGKKTGADEIEREGTRPAESAA
jgi:hypothetical protein